MAACKPLRGGRRAARQPVEAGRGQKMRAEGMHASSVHPRRIRARPAVYNATTTYFRNALLEPATSATPPRRRRSAVASPFTRTPHRYVPDGLSAAQWKKMQADKKKNAAANKLKYPKGAAQVVGVKEYLEDLAKKQTFFRDAAGNSRVGDTGHKWAKVKFGEFTKEAYDEWRAKGGKKLPNQMY